MFLILSKIFVELLNEKLVRKKIFFVLSGFQTIQGKKPFQVQIDQGE